MKKFSVVKGVYPTMITPYKDGKIDEDGVRALVKFYWDTGCDGIFAVCQSSEIMFLSLEERVLLTRLVVAEAKKLAESDTSRAPMMIVASGFFMRVSGRQGWSGSGAEAVFYGSGCREEQRSRPPGRARADCG